MKLVVALAQLPLLFVFAEQVYSATSCPKVIQRREWRTLPNEDKAGWLASVKCLASLRHPRLSFTSQGTILPGKPSLYDDFAYTHDALEDSAHFNAYFLPWHRWFAYLFDSALRQKCGYSGPTPYWDWTLDAHDLIASPIFDPSLTHGLGTNGDCDTTDCLIFDGALSSYPPFSLSYPIPHTLRRNISLYTGKELNELPENTTLSHESIQNYTDRSRGDFFRFQYHMTMAHNHVHEFVGGDMNQNCPREVPEAECTGAYASNDPLFWLHHVQLDRLWSKWQLSYPENYAAFAGFPLHSHNLSDPRYDINASATHRLKFDRLSVPITVNLVFNHSAFPFCYEYVEMDQP